MSEQESSSDTNESKPFFERIDQRPNPQYTSYVLRNIHYIKNHTALEAHSASLVVANTSSSQLSTEGQDNKSRSKNLKPGEDEDLLKILGPDYSDQFKSPYDAVDLIRFHEAWRDDGIAASALDFLIQFMLGDHFKTIIDVNAEFDTEEEAAAALEFFNNNPKIREYKRKIDRVNRELKFQTHIFSLLVQAFVFGRACALVEKSPIDGLPSAIKVLPSMHLGQVYAHRKTWQVLGVEHLDFPFPASIIKSEDMIYFPVRDNNISPGTLHYGYSIYERIVDLSELNRITNQRNLKEINYRLWAALMLIKLPGTYNQAVMNKLKEDLKNGAGNSIVTNQAAEFEVLKIDHDMEKLIDQRSENYREIIRQLQVPIILFDPDILNRATSQELMEAWTISVLKSYRTWLKDIIQDQWINPILKTMIESEREQARTEGSPNNIEPQIPEPSKPSKPTDDNEEEKNPQDKGKATPSIAKQVIPIEAIDPITGDVIVYRLPWKIKIEFEPHNYDTFKEKAETAILLKNNGLMTTGTALKSLGITDENELAQLLEMEEERRQMNMQMQGAEVAAQQQKEVAASKEKDPGKARTIENQRLRLRDQLTKSVRGKNVGITEGQRARRGPAFKR